MKRKIPVKTEPKYPEVIGEVEFAKAADELLEVIRMYYKHRDGVNLTREQRLEIAQVVLESRL